MGLEVRVRVRVRYMFSTCFVHVTNYLDKEKCKYNTPQAQI